MPPSPVIFGREGAMLLPEGWTGLDSRPHSPTEQASTGDRQTLTRPGLLLEIRSVQTSTMDRPSVDPAHLCPGPEHVVQEPLGPSVTFLAGGPSDTTRPAFSAMIRSA